MSISAATVRTVFKDGGGGDGGAGGALTNIMKHRFLYFLMWQSLNSIFLLFFTKTLFLSPFTTNPFTPNFFSFIAFHISLLIFSISLFFVSFTYPLPYASPSEISRLIFVDQRLSRKRVLSFTLFVCVCAVAGAESVISICWGCDVYYDRVGVLGKLGFRGFLMGFCYGLYYVYKRRWVFQFPIIQRPPFFRFEIVLRLSV